MPNWCSTRIAVFGSEKDVNDLHTKIEEISKTGRLENGFGNLWEGNLLDLYGIDWRKVRCRGQIVDFNSFEEDGYLELWQEDAWGPNTEYLKEIIKKAGYDLDLVYVAEEPGCGVYINTDTSGDYFPERYLIDFLVSQDIPELGLKTGDELYEYFENESTALSALARFGLYFRSMKEAKESFNEYSDSFEYSGIHLFQKGETE